MAGRECKLVTVSSNKLEKHPNADSLSIFREDGIQVVVRTESWTEGALALWCPPDSIVPEDVPEWSWAKGRVKVTKLRGAISEGLLLPLKDEPPPGVDLAAHYGIGHYEPVESLGQGQAASPPGGHFPHYDVESFQKMCADIMGKEVWVTEKLHGQNICVVYKDGEHHVRSRSVWKKDIDNCVFWAGARNTSGLLDLARNHPNMAFYGEQFGHVKNFKYGLTKPEVRLFDVYDLDTHRWLDYQELVGIVPPEMLVPTDYLGVFSEPNLDDIRKLCESPSNFAKQSVREGTVVKPLVNGVNQKGDRLMCKFVNPAYFERS